MPKNKMTEEATNSDWILVGKEKNDFKKLETNFENLQKEFVEEKEKTANLKRKNDCLEYELKEMDKKIQKIDSKHKNEIEEMKQKFQQLIDKNDVCFKQDGKINSFEEEIFEEMNFVKIEINGKKLNIIVVIEIV
uniref:Uncharacterized protein n=1 Tax=Meloidogyne enterolobii TaxID=390850 RepID=A0A6V7XRK9_MELEN|nr:unnamed protein product [Meloidogyne enterolobii]